MIDDLFLHDFMALHLLEVVYCVSFYTVSARFIRFVCGFVFTCGLPLVSENRSNARLNIFRRFLRSDLEHNRHNNNHFKTQNPVVSK